MTSLIQKLLITTLILSTSVFASNTTVSKKSVEDQKIIDFFTAQVVNNPKIEIKSIKVAYKQDLNIDDWFGYIIDISLTLLEDKEKGTKARDIDTHEILFSNGELTSTELYSAEGMDFKRSLHPDLSFQYYNKDHLIAGSSKAKNKIVIFSDPLCPFCIDYAPKLMSAVIKNPKTFALYYYSLPLERIHPQSRILIKAGMALKSKGIKNVELKIYQADFSQYFKHDAKDLATSPVDVLKIFNKAMKSKVTLDQIANPKYEVEIQHDEKMSNSLYIQGTPAVYLNGKFDNSRYGFEKLIK